MRFFLQYHPRGGRLVDGELIVYGLFLILALLYGAYKTHKETKKQRQK